MDDFLQALLKRATFVEWLKANDVAYRALPEGAGPSGLAGIIFESGDESWAVGYHHNGNFRLLTWA